MKQEQLAARANEEVRLRRLGYSYREIAEKLDVSPSQVHADVQKILEEIRKDTASGKSGSSSSNHGTSNLLTATVEPTQVPTATPTAVPTVVATALPTTQATQKSPAPLAGLVLGTAALLMRMRR